MLDLQPGTVADDKYEIFSVRLVRVILTRDEPLNRSGLLGEDSTTNSIGIFK